MLLVVSQRLSSVFPACGRTRGETGRDRACSRARGKLLWRSDLVVRRLWVLCGFFVCFGSLLQSAEPRTLPSLGPN